MGQDEITLRVLSLSGEEPQRSNAKKVLSLLHKGKHWILVTLLLGNVIVNETLPIVLDKEMMGGWVAIVVSTCLIVIFGEIIPQSLCAKWGLSIGAKSST
jgi:metal transporter CNNM